MLSSVESPLASAFAGQLEATPGPRVLRTASLQVTEFIATQHDAFITGTVPRDDAYVITLHLRQRPPGAMQAEGRWLKPQNFSSGHAGIVDLRMRLVSEYAGPFHYVSYFLSRAALDAVTDDAGARRIDDLHYRLGVGFSDPIVRHLLSSLRPALALPEGQISRLYADHVALAFASHIACTYGELRPAPKHVRGGLTPPQERRVKELLDARLDGTVSLAELARSCDLSVRHFARAFQQSTGQAPHRWLTERRLDRAQGLLRSSARSLREIASDCGFASQSHFTRVFSRALGVSPGAFRRARPA